MQVPGHTVTQTHGRTVASQMHFTSTSSTGTEDDALAIERLVLGAVFFAHGAQKVPGASSSDRGRGHNV